jgi:putative CocE/NonD family hydrolase
VTFTLPGYPDKWDRVSAPAVHLTGWYDIFNQQQIDAYNAYQTKSSFGKGLNFLIIMPTGHCAGGQVPWPNALDGYTFANTLSTDLFKAVGSYEQDNLAARRRLAGIAPMWWYVMGPGLPGTLGNYWTNGTAFPAATATALYLSSGNISMQPPVSDSARSFAYDPRNPVPTRGGNNLVLPQCGPWDQAGLEARADVLVYTSARLSKPVFIAGQMSAVLYVTSNCTDTDFTVKVTDVFPNSTSLLVQDGIVRMRWRNGGTTPSLLTPGAVYEVTVDVWSTSYIFNAGHAIRIDISSSNFPRFSVNPNTGEPLDSTAAPVPALNTVLAGPNYPSRLILPVVDGAEMPPIGPMPRSTRQ